MIIESSADTGPNEQKLQLRGGHDAGMIRQLHDTVIDSMCDALDQPRQCDVMEKKKRRLTPELEEMVDQALRVIRAESINVAPCINCSLLLSPVMGPLSQSGGAPAEVVRWGVHVC